MNETGQNFFQLPDVFTTDTDNFTFMIQNVLVGLIFIAAILYVGRLIYDSFRSRNSCPTGCGKCAAVDFKKLEQQLKESSAFTVHHPQPPRQ